ncbi:hypothetical protein CYMTET_37675 [Cymbomonas tetramitiformis]|uniref:RNA-dependent RNA polymerase n=1 Tax=Cymbomonas tetramitiformis TaxID=36881 RepID=A0AAE0F5Q8_9CHLO|nr:hypothetical protein CYMTET_37675 [Cymbomonas tetramitiformis]
MVTLLIESLANVEGSEKVRYKEYAMSILENWAPSTLLNDSPAQKGSRECLHKRQQRKRKRACFKKSPPPPPPPREEEEEEQDQEEEEQAEEQDQEEEERECDQEQKQLEPSQREQTERATLRGLIPEHPAEGCVGVPAGFGGPATSGAPAAGLERVRRSCQSMKAAYHFQQQLCMEPQISVRTLSCQVARSPEEKQLCTKAKGVLTSTFPSMKPHMQDMIDGSNVALMLLGLEPVTVATYVVRPNTLHVYLFTTRERRRRQNFGGLLVTWLKQLACEKGLSYLLVGAVSEPDVLSFWYRFGFTPAERHGVALARHTNSMEAQTNCFQNTTLLAWEVQPTAGEVEARLFKAQQTARQGVARLCLPPVDHGKAFQTSKHGKAFQTVDHGKAFQTSKYGKAFQTVDHGKAFQTSKHGKAFQTVDHGKAFQTSKHGKALTRFKHSKSFKGANQDLDDNTACEVCYRSDDDEDNDMLLCDGRGCGVGMHLRCISPPLAGVPDGDWYCPSCAKEREGEPQLQRVLWRDEGEAEAERAGGRGEAHAQSVPAMRGGSPAMVKIRLKSRKYASPERKKGLGGTPHRYIVNAQAFPVVPAAPAWQAPCCTPLEVAGVRIDALMLSPPPPADSLTGTTNFLSLLMHERVMKVETALPKHGAALAKPHLPLEGRQYELVVSKVHSEVDLFQKKHSVHSLYVAVSGPGMAPINLQSTLEQWADFAALPTVRKVQSRLELLRSPVQRRRAFELCASEHFEVLEHEAASAATGEPMGDGCGFIPEAMLAHFTPKGARGVLAVQVRVFSPRLGVFKGMLCCKPGIARIQLLPSMRKVGPSRVPWEGSGSDDIAVLLIKQVHPSNPNVRIGKQLAGADGTADVQPAIRKHPSAMLRWLFESLGVPRGVFTAYFDKEAYKLAYLVGVADPTHSLPAGTIFVPGLPLQGTVARVSLFVTRFPCVKPEDGRMLPALNSRPGPMLDDAWEWLQALPFGAVVFSTAGDGAPLPAQCASGDLDGDLYLVCWDRDFISHIKPRQLAAPSTPALPPVVQQQPFETPCDPDWLPRAQARMHAEELLCEPLDIPKVFKLFKKEVETSPDGMDSVDARLLGEAYVRALDRGKHGGDLGLPHRLQGKLEKVA